MSDDGDEESPTGQVAEIGEQVAQGLEHAAEAEEGDEDVATGLETAGDVVGAVAEGARLVGGAGGLAEDLAEGDGVGAAGSAGNLLGGSAGVAGAALDGVAGLVDDERLSEGLGAASGVLRTVAGAARQVGQIVSTVEGALQSAFGDHVEYEVHFDGASGWKVTGFEMSEALDEPYELVLDVNTEDRDADPRSLLGANTELLLERGERHHRRITGMVRRVVESHQRSHHVSARLYVVPALWALGQGRDSVIFQEQTAAEILETVLTRALSPYRREVDVSGLSERYPTREYCVQYRESHLSFCHRLMEEEGIGYCFDASGEGWEKLVLFDRSADAAAVPTVDDDAIPFRAQVGIVVAAAEPIVELSPARELGATQVVVRDYDWTQAETRVEASVEGRDGRGRTRSVYEHGHGRAVSLYDFQPGGRYQANDVSARAQDRHRALVRDEERSSGVSLVIGMGARAPLHAAGPPDGRDGRRLPRDAGPSPEGAAARGGAPRGGRGVPQHLRVHPAGHAVGAVPGHAQAGHLRRADGGRDGRRPRRDPHRRVRPGPDPLPLGPRGHRADELLAPGRAGVGRPRRDGAPGVPVHPARRDGGDRHVHRR